MEGSLSRVQRNLLLNQRRARELKHRLLSSNPVDLALYRRYKVAKAELDKMCRMEGLICP